MAINDIKISQLTELDLAETTDDTAYVVVEGDSNFKLLMGTISDYVISKIPSIFNTLTFDYAKANSILDIPDTYTPVVSMITPERDEGVYMVGMALTASFADTNDSFYIRWSTDDGTIWNEFIFTPTSIQDKVPVMYTYPIEFSGGVVNFRLEARKETGGNTFNINFADVWFERKGN